MALPTASDTQVTYGGVGYYYMEERLATGAALGSPDTPHKVSKIGEIKISRKASNATTTTITAKSNANEEITALQAFNPGSVSATTAPDIEITFSHIESSPEDLDVYATVAGKYYVGTFPLGTHYSGATAKKVELYAFGQFEDGGEINVSPDKPTEVPMKMHVKTNSVAITTATNSDTNLGATTATIAQYAGYKYNAA